MTRVRVIADSSDAMIAEALHERLAWELGRTEGAVAIAVPGGTTPFPILEQLAGTPLEWNRVEVWPTDDRQVPDDHPASNFGRIAGLLEPPGGHVVRLRTGASPPHFAFSWLGMGADGHIASLFASGPDFEGREVVEVVPDPLPPEAPYPRLSLTIHALLDADEVIFVIRGGEKWSVFDAAMRGEGDLPVARLLRAAQQQVTCFT
jgi:6-phosphogluconolactonase